MKTRVLTAVILLPLLLLIVLGTPKIITAILFCVMASVGAWELLSGTGYLRQKRLVVYSMIMAVLVSLNSYFVFDSIWICVGILLFWVLLLAEIMYSNMQLSFDNVFLCFAAGILVPYLLTALVRIQVGEFGRWFMLIPFVLAFLSDTGAYFVGRAFGRHKLAPLISPKKTVEGVFGGVLGAVIGMVAYCAVLQIFFDFRVNYLYALIYGVIGSVAAVFGDLCFSVIKRQTGIKDYGKVFPGHGGILDRFDSMIVVAPLTEILLAFLPLAVKV